MVMESSVWGRGGCPIVGRVFGGGTGTLRDAITYWFVMTSGLSRWAPLGMGVATVLLLIQFPTTFCIACEVAATWQKESPEFVLWWLVGAPFVAALWGGRNGAIVAAASVVALLVAQPVGGVPDWSFFNNEGPFIVLFGTPVFFGCYLAGRLVRTAIRAFVGISRRYAATST